MADITWAIGLIQNPAPKKTTATTISRQSIPAGIGCIVSEPNDHALGAERKAPKGHKALANDSETAVEGFLAAPSAL